MKIYEAFEGQKVIIKNLVGSRRQNRKLLSVGIYPGKEVTIFHKRGRGSLIVKVNDSYMIIGFGLTKAIVICSGGEIGATHEI